LTRESAGKSYVSSRLARAANALTGTALDRADNSVFLHVQLWRSTAPRWRREQSQTAAAGLSHQF
jgi:hypothetical protein